MAPPRVRLQRAGVIVAGDAGGPVQEIEVQLEGGRLAARCDVALVGGCEPGDVVLVAGTATGLWVHANLTSGLGDVTSLGEARDLGDVGSLGDSGGVGDTRLPADSAKLGGTSLAHAVRAIDADGAVPQAARVPVGVLLDHYQLAPAAWAIAQAAPSARVGYVQTPGGALSAAATATAGTVAGQGLLAGHVTAGAAFGAGTEALSIAGALGHGATTLGWDAILCGPGPSASGTAAELAALDTAHAALALGAPTVLVPHFGEGEGSGARSHQGLSAATNTVLRLLLDRVIVALPDEVRRAWDFVPGRHAPILRFTAADPEGYAATALPGADAAPALLAGALAAGRLLGEMTLRASALQGRSAG